MAAAAAAAHQRLERMLQEDLATKANNVLYQVRTLRSRAHRLHEDIFTSLEEGDGPDEMRRRILPLCAKLNKGYDALEELASSLPDRTAMDKEKFERIKLLFQDELVDLSHSQLIDKVIQSANRHEANWQMNFYTANFLQNAYPTTRRKNFSTIPTAVSYSEFTRHNNPHARFEAYLNACSKDFLAKKTSIFITMLEKSCSSCIFEIRSGHFLPNRSTKDFVCLQRAVVIENEGAIDKVSFYAPNEELVMIDDFGEKRVDLRVQSRYEVYRRLSINTNIYLLQQASASDWRHLVQILHWLSKVYQATESPCKVCKKVLKDFMPPTAYNPSNIKSTSHETCR